MAKSATFRLLGMTLDLPAAVLALVFFMGGWGIIIHHASHRPGQETPSSQVTQEASKTASAISKVAVVEEASQVAEESPSPSPRVVYSEEERATFEQIFDLASLDTQEVATTERNLPTVKPIAPQSETVHYAVVDQFDDLSSATQRALALNRQGHDARILYPEASKTKPYRVYIFRNNNLSLVEDFLRSHRQEGSLSGQPYSRSK